MSSAPTIGAIETTYKGVRFRSRLEARWAVFFDALEVSWKYEPEGYSDGTLTYLPDFWLPGEESFWEIKPKDHGQNEAEHKLAMDKAYMLASLTVGRVFVCCGPPEHGLYGDPRDGIGYDPEGVDHCGGLGMFAWAETNIRGPHIERRDWLSPGEHTVKRINQAAARARAYRFWNPR